MKYSGIDLHSNNAVVVVIDDRDSEHPEYRKPARQTAQSTHQWRTCAASGRRSSASTRVAAAHRVR